jgi:hypothetical protein
LCSVPSTIEALLVVLVAILPGGLYVWAFERQLGSWGIGATDRVLRFVGTSAVFLAILAGPGYLLWRRWLHDVDVVEGRRTVTNHVADGDAPWWLVTALPILYVAAPLALGTAVALFVRADSEWTAARWAHLSRRLLVGRAPAPRAWDALFSRVDEALIRVKLKTGAWIGGGYGDRSYASGYPHAPQDLLLEQTFQMRDDGSFEADEQGGLVPLDTSLLLRWDEIESIEVIRE